MDKIYRYDLTRAVILALGVLVLWRLKLVFLILLISFVFAVVLHPFVQRLHRFHLPAALAVLLPIGVVVGAFTGIVYYVGPAVADQLPEFINDFPLYLESLPFGDQISKELSSISGFFEERFRDVDQILEIGAVLVKAVVGVLTVTVVTIYWLGSYEGNKETLISFLPKRQRIRGKDIWDRIEVKLGKWFLGQIMVSTAVGVLVWGAARLLGLPYAGVLGLISAMLEIIPNVGPVLAALPAIMIGGSESLEKALIVTIVYLFIQQFENHILTPQLMGRTVKLHPIIIIISILCGGLLLGVAGALFAVPTALLISAAVDSFRHGINDEDLPRLKKTEPKKA